MVYLPDFNLDDTCGQVKEKLTKRIGSFGNQKKIIVPKTTVLRAIKDGEIQNVLFTCWEHERCQGLTDYSGVSSEVDTMKVIGRQVGECSIVVNLDNVAKVFMSLSLHKAINKESVIVAYPLGNNSFVCAIGKHFLKEYNQRRELEIEK